MNLRPLVFALLLGACSDFDQLGREARCRATSCDGGVVVDGGLDGGVDAGLDAGAPDAGAPDAGDPDAGDADAGLLQLHPLWAQADLVPASAFTFRPGFIAAAGPSRVAHLREFLQLVDGPELYPDSGVFFPAGSILGDVVLLELDTGDFVLEDGGRSQAPTDSALRSFVLGQRGTPTTRGPFLLVPSSERLVDGGAVPTRDGGPAAYGDAVMSVLMPTLEVATVIPTGGVAKGATSLALPNGGQTLSWLPTGPDAGMFSLQTMLLSQTAGIDCDAPLIDVVTTLKSKVSGPDHRMVQLAECTPDALSVIAWSYDAAPAVTPVALLQTRGGRLAIGPEALTQRNPYVAWKGADSLLRLTRFNEEGTNPGLTRAIPRVAPGARIGALAVDAQNFPLVIIESPSITLPELSVSAPGTELILASFRENLELRWAAPLAGVNRLRVNSATFVGEALVLDVSCPRTNVQPGDFCQSESSTWAVRVGLSDGGFPP